MLAISNIHFIVNPVAGSGKCAERFAEAERLLRDRKVDFSVSRTEYPRHAVELAKAAIAAGHRIIVAVGGDGTMGEVASALMKHSEISFGMFPFGTGNDIARALPLPTDPAGAVDNLLSGNVCSIDMGLANGRPFVNVGGFGFDVDVLVNTQRYKKNRGGMIPYLRGLLASMFHLRTVRAHITIDDDEFDSELLLAAVGNGKSYGGGMPITPRAVANDGYFDVCLIQKVSLPVFITMLPLFLKGKHLGKKPVRYFRARKLRFECSPDCLIQLDGEIMRGTPVNFELVPSALRVICPAPAR